MVLLSLQERTRLWSADGAGFGNHTGPAESLFPTAPGPTAESFPPAPFSSMGLTEMRAMGSVIFTSAGRTSDPVLFHYLVARIPPRIPRFAVEFVASRASGFSRDASRCQFARCARICC